MFVTSSHLHKTTKQHLIFFFAIVKLQILLYDNVILHIQQLSAVMSI